ncbi:hypothetical protein SDC9_155876 [bioreactor metagenome]|uniref:Uncharacterized protein n=1 Tax=bioreactor metagenome TaxID=1076179 RepID=A0A645F7X5_9ZZZZ
MKKQNKLKLILMICMLELIFKQMVLLLLYVGIYSRMKTKFHIHHLDYIAQVGHIIQLEI